MSFASSRFQVAWSGLINKKILRLHTPFPLCYYNSSVVKNNEMPKLRFYQLPTFYLFPTSVSLLDFVKQLEIFFKQAWFTHLSLSEG